jgi:5-methylcytosine-specific restriction enzyme A
MGKPTPRLRGRAGQKQRDRRLKRTNYLCEDCQAEGRITFATIVDHIIPLAHGGPDTDKNTRNLCVDHNLKRTAEQFALRAPNQPISVDGRPRDPSHPWNRKPIGHG